MSDATRFGLNLFYQSPAVSLRLLKEFGYTCVDYSCAFPFEKMAPDELCAIRDLTKSLGLVPFALHMPFAILPYRHNSRMLKAKLRKIGKVIEVAELLGVKRLTAHPGVPDTVDFDIPALVDHLLKVGREAIERQAVEVLGEMAAMAAPRGITIAIENGGSYIGRDRVLKRYTTAAELVELIGKVGYRNIGVCFDAGHANTAGWDVAENIRVAGAHLVQLHLHDNMGEPDGDLHLPPGRGTIDWKAVHAALGDAGYTGPITFELNLTDTIENVLSEPIAYWRGLCDAVT